MLFISGGGEIVSDGGIRQCDGRKLCGDHLRCDEHQSDSEQQLYGPSKQDVLQYY
jgi:hypothetical protein